VIDGRYGGCCWCFVTAPQEAAATIYFRRTSLVLADWMIAMATSRVEKTPAPKGPASRPRGGARIGWIVAGSLVIGLVAALLLPFAPFIPAEESAVTGGVLCGFALGWAMLAVLSVRFTDQPQRWAAVPALFMALGGVLLIAFGSTVHRVLDWVWPPALLALAIWMFVCVRRQRRSRIGRWLLYPVIGLLALAAIGGGYATVGAAADARAYPMAGQLIDVGGHRLHLNCTGSGSPTVVLQPGGGEMSSNMGWIAPAVARNTRVCVYDRAGRGWSEPADTAQDGLQIAADLHTLLQRGGVPGPYVLAGHSFGGLYVLSYAARYPGEVAGMVLIDCTDFTPTQARTVSSVAGSYNVLRRVSALASISSRIGLARLYAPLEGSGLPPRSGDEVRAHIAGATGLSSTIEEYVQANASSEEAPALRTFDDKPLVVLTAGVGNDAKHSAAQNNLATLSTNVAHRTIKDAAHEDLVADEHAAAATTQAILDVVQAVKSHTPLQQGN
jgi:pimeloyl-ACP methyl ester carboxylesterase